MIQLHSVALSGIQDHSGSSGEGVRGSRVIQCQKNTGFSIEGHRYTGVIQGQSGIQGH